jgi:hypothetical protein
VIQIDVVSDALPVSRPTALPITKAMASASISRTTFVVAVRRSALCNISCANSCWSARLNLCQWM